MRNQIKAHDISIVLGVLLAAYGVYSLLGGAVLAILAGALFILGGLSSALDKTEDGK